jgi:hypothetical protein
MQGVHKGVCTRLAQHIRVDRDVVIADMMARDCNRRVDSFHANRGVFFVHCVCHRLALVLTDGIKGTGSCEQVMPDVCITLLNNLYNYFAMSPRRKKALKQYIASENAANVARRQRHDLINPQDALEEVLGVLVERHKLPKHVVMMRWLSTADAVRVVLNCRDLYIIFFTMKKTMPPQTF